MKRLQVLAEDAGALQTKIHPGCAAHTPLMESARESLGRVLKEMAPRMRPPTCDVYINVTGEPVRRGANPRNLVKFILSQLTEPVLWDTCVKNMVLAGIEKFYELGPRSQLKQMMKRIDTAAYEKTECIQV